MSAETLIEISEIRDEILAESIITREIELDSEIK
jgi:hypothetical protein